MHPAPALELIVLTAQRQLLECRCRFREQDDVERVVRPIRQRHFLQHHAGLLAASSAARSTSVAGFVFIHSGK
jgi:hypothetical protein